MYHLAIPSADCDYVTAGLLIPESTEKEELSIVDATDKEYMIGQDEGSKLCAERINKKENRSDLKPSIISFCNNDGFFFQDIFSDDYAETICRITQP